MSPRAGRPASAIRESRLGRKASAAARQSRWGGCLLLVQIYCSLLSTINRSRQRSRPCAPTSRGCRSWRGRRWCGCCRHRQELVGELEDDLPTNAQESRIPSSFLATRGRLPSQQPAHATAQIPAWAYPFCDGRIILGSEHEPFRQSPCCAYRSRRP
jgi:hypothetical protein